MQTFQPEIVWRHTNTLIPYEKNAKKHPPEQIDDIAGQISQFGFDQPIVIDEKSEILKGHGRWLAATALALTMVPCIVRSDLTDVQKIAMRIGDNKVAESEWDNDFLKFEFGTLQRYEVDIPQVTGFKADEVTIILDGWKSDLQRVEKTSANLDGIGGVIKVKCPQAIRKELKEFLLAQVAESGFEDVEFE